MVEVLGAKYHNDKNKKKWKITTKWNGWAKREKGENELLWQKWENKMFTVTLLPPKQTKTKWHNQHTIPYSV